MSSITCIYFQQSVCLLASKMSGNTTKTSEAICVVCLAQSTRTNHVTASLALGTVLRPLQEDKKYLLDLVKKIPEHGPGTELKSLISWFPIPQNGCKSCRNLERKMNNWGPRKCLQKIEYIHKKLKIAALRRRLPYSHFLIDILIRKAIKNAVDSSSNDITT